MNPERLTARLLGLVEKGTDHFIAAALWEHTRQQHRQFLADVLFGARRTRQALVGWPHTGPQVLDALARGKDDKTALRTARHPNTGGETLRWLVCSRRLDGALLPLVAAHPHTPQEVFDTLPWRTDMAVRRGLCANARVPRSLLTRLALAATTSQERKALARNRATDGALLDRLWDPADRFLCAEVLAHPNCPVERLTAGAASDDDLLRRKCAENPALDQDTVARLLLDASAEVRASAARNPALTAGDLAALASDASTKVRRSNARNSGLGRAVLDRLSRDSDPWVRRWVARNPETSEPFLERLADDQVSQVRRAVTRNPNCPRGLVERLARDDNPWVRAGVAYRDDLPVNLILAMQEDRSADVIAGLGRNPHCPPQLMEKICRSADTDVRRSVILNRAAPKRVLSKLFEDPYPLNRVLLVQHRGLQANDLVGFLEDPDGAVRFVAAGRLLEVADQEGKSIEH